MTEILNILFNISCKEKVYKETNNSLIVTNHIKFSKILFFSIFLDMSHNDPMEPERLKTSERKSKDDDGDTPDEMLPG